MNQSTTITETVATVAKLIWQGATTSEGDFLWYPDNIGAPFSGLANTTCNNGTCVGVPFFLPEIWIKDFLTLDRNFGTSRINTTYFEELFHQSVNLYDSLLGPSDSHLDGFRKAGGKLINWQGLADQFVAPDATAHYVKELHARDPKTSDYYRFFEAPGVNHCGGGQGWYPGEGLKALINWVENGVAPETLAAETPAGRKANICLWPKQLVYMGGNPDQAASFECQ